MIMVVLLDRVQHSLQTNNNNFRTTLHHFASNGDVEAVTSLLENHPEIDVDIHSSKSRNTALHAALIQNQQGFIIEYLIQKGANVNAYSTKGFNPLVLAIKHCRNGTQALETLIEAGASLERFEKGRFVGLTLLDLARQWKNEDAIRILTMNGCVEGMEVTKNQSILCDGNEIIVKNEQSLSSRESDVPKQLNGNNSKPSTSINSKKALNQKPKKALCPQCNCFVKFPTRMCFLTFNQEQAEKEYNQILKQKLQDSRDRDCDNDINEPGSEAVSVKTSNGSEIYIKRKYLDQFMTHNNGESYRKLCKIEFHGVGNMHKLRKEISESYSILHAVQECWMALKGTKEDKIITTDDAVNFENVYLVDLCSGKSMTAALCSVLFPEANNNRVLAVDKLPSHMVPHYFHEGNITYFSRDIMTEIFYKELEEAIKRQTINEGRTVILVGMHLCGLLSERAIEFFNRMQDIRAIVLSPCCLPKLRKGKSVFNPSNVLDEDGKYMAWSDHLKTKIEACMPDATLDQISSYYDDEMHSVKNLILTATRLKKL